MKQLGECWTFHLHIPDNWDKNKSRGHISCTRWVIANLILFSNFSYHGNSVGLRRILLILFTLIRWFRKLPLGARIGYITPVRDDLANFLLKFPNFRYHGNRGLVWDKFFLHRQIHRPTPKIPLFGARIGDTSSVKDEL